MTTNQVITTLSILTFLSCNPKQPDESTQEKATDTLKTQSFFNKNEKLYVVQKIRGDTIDPDGNNCNFVEMKNAEGGIFESCFLKGDTVEIGATLWIGYNASGEAYIVRLNKK